MQGLEYYIRRNTKLELVIHEMIDLVGRIENKHDQYEEYLENYDKIERETLENFARVVIDDSSFSVKGILPRIQNLASGPGGNEFRVLGNKGLLELIAIDMEVSQFFMIFFCIIGYNGSLFINLVYLQTFTTAENIKSLVHLL